MSRVPCKRRLGQSACYHVIDRGHNREAVFKDAEDCGSFLRLLGRYAKRFSWRLYHYCLMTNHFHLLLRLEDGRRLSGLMAGLLRSYVHYFNRRHGFVGHLWQGRFKSPAVEAERYLLSCGRYIERNPLEAGMVEEPWAYQWSSCRAYALGEADPLLTEDPYYTELAADPCRRQARWREFLLSADPGEEVVRRSDWVVGEEGFRRRMQQMKPRPAPRGRGRPRKPGAGRRLFPQLFDAREEP